MSSSPWITTSTLSFSESLDRVAEAIERADAVLVGAGAGLSTAAGLTYSGERFERLFPDFIERYHIADMYSGGFYPYPDQETFWAWWSRAIWCNRYHCELGQPYKDLVAILAGREHFVLTTNVDHQFQRAGLDKERLFYTQGDYGLFQCSVPCHQKTYDNYDQVKAMVAQQRDCRVPTALLPKCPVCGEPMTLNLRSDDTFVEDAGWHAASRRYGAWLRAHADERVVLLEIGVGGNTPGIIKYPFWQMAAANPEATYVQLNFGEVLAPAQIASQSVLIDADAASALAGIRARLDA